MERFTKLDSAGKALPLEATEWSQVRDAETNLIWPADLIGDAEVNWKQSIGDAAGCQLGGATDWAKPTPQQLLSILDFDKSGPAIDTRFFRYGSAWVWTNKVAAWAPQHGAWLVLLGYGFVYPHVQGYKARVLVCRSAGASQ